MSKKLVAKTVFGELTLGDVLKKFHKNISAITVEYEDKEATYDNWYFDEGELQIIDEYEKVCSFPLDAKVKVRSDELEFENENGTFILTFMEHKKVKFDSLLPKKS